jgi:hypothetical protein
MKETGFDSNKCVILPWTLFALVTRTKANHPASRLLLYSLTRGERTNKLRYDCGNDLCEL